MTVIMWQLFGAKRFALIFCLVISIPRKSYDAIFNTRFEFM